MKQLRDAHYVWLGVNWSPQNRNEHVLSQWPRVKAYPHLFVLDEAGHVVHSHASSQFEASKDYDREKMIAFLTRHRRP